MGRHVRAIWPKLLSIVALTVAIQAGITGTASAQPVNGCAPGGNSAYLGWSLSGPAVTQQNIPGTTVKALILEPASHFYTYDYAYIGKSYIKMQEDGNFVLYDETCQPRWASNTANQPAASNVYQIATFDPDGDLGVELDLATHAYHTIYDCWGDSNCDSFGSERLAIQADGNVVLYRTNTIPWVVNWATNTWH